MVELRGYIDENGKRRFAIWFESLNAIAAAKVTIALTRIEQGNLSNAKGVGGGVLEYKIDFGPGGTKKRQDEDITEAQPCWVDYKRRKKNAPYP